MDLDVHMLEMRPAYLPGSGEIPVTTRQSGLAGTYPAPTQTPILHSVLRAVGLAATNHGSERVWSFYLLLHAVVHSETTLDSYCPMTRFSALKIICLSVVVGGFQLAGRHLHFLYFFCVIFPSSFMAALMSAVVSRDLRSTRRPTSAFDDAEVSTPTSLTWINFVDCSTLTSLQQHNLQVHRQLQVESTSFKSQFPIKYMPGAEKCYL